MLKQIRFINWKSFSDTVLYIDPLTVLIGTNASGKSNVLDGLAFLSRAVQGEDLQSILTGTSANEPVRGGLEWAAKKPGNEFGFEAVVEEENVDYRYCVSFMATPHVEILNESLTKVEYIPEPDDKKETNLFSASRTLALNALVITYKSIKLKKIEAKKTLTVISQLKSLQPDEEVEEAILYVLNALENIFILDPIPSLMRDYKPLSPQLASNASNIAGVLAALPEREKETIENILSQYVSKLPEGEVRKVWAETVGRLKSDAMLYCEEKWIEGNEPLIVDARGMSDGTLRFLAILTALLTEPEGTLIVVDEIDSGLHPSRARLLLEVLKEIGQKRIIDILVTTHNPALMDELGPEMVPFVVIANRSPQTGDSQLTLLEDVKNLPKLLAMGSLGKITTRGYIEQSLSGEEGAGSEG